MPSRTLRSDTVGRVRLRLAKRSDGTLAARYWRPDGITDVIEGDPGEHQDDLWARLRTAALRDPAYFGFEGAIERFLTLFPEGFQDPNFLQQERNYKVEASTLVNTTVPLGTAAVEGGYVESAIRAYHSTNLIDARWERPALVEALRSPDGDRLIQHIANFALGDWSRLEAIAAVCARCKVTGKWPVATYLPFLWQTDNPHAILRYEPTTTFAARVGHEFAAVYDPDLKPTVYHSFLDLLDTTRTAIADLEPRDMIDVQSFVWVVSKYPD